MKVHLLCCDIDLGYNVEHVSVDETRMRELAAAYNERDRRTWIGGDGIERKSTDKWWVFSQELEDFTVNSMTASAA